MKKIQSNRVIHQASLQQSSQMNTPIVNKSILAANGNIGGQRVAQSQELFPKFFTNNPPSLRQSSNFGKQKEEVVQFNQSQPVPNMENQRYSISSLPPQVLNQVKSQPFIVNGVNNGSEITPGNSKSIDTASIKQSQRRLISSGQKNVAHNVQSKHQRGQGQPINHQQQISSQQTNQGMQNSQANISTGNGSLIKYNVKNGNYSFKTAGKNHANARTESQKIDSHRVTASNTLNRVQGNAVSSSVQVQSIRQLVALGNSNLKPQANAAQQKIQYAGNSANSVVAVPVPVPSNRKMSHQHNNVEMFQSMSSEQYQQKLLIGAQEDAQLKTSTLLSSELEPLNSSGGFNNEQRERERERGLRNKDDKNKQQLLSLSKKLIKPLTGNKQQNQSQQILVFPNPTINSLLTGSNDPALDSARPVDQQDSHDMINSLNFLSTGVQQHQSQKIRIPKHALANINKRNPVDFSTKGSFVSQGSGNNQNSKSTSQQKHAKKNNQQLQQLHGHGGQIQNQTRFGSSGFNSQSLNPQSISQTNLSSKLKSTANRENFTNFDRKPIMSAIIKPRFASNKIYDEASYTNITEPTMQASNQASMMMGSQSKSNTLANLADGKKRHLSNSERISLDKQQIPEQNTVAQDGLKTNISETRIQSRAIAKFIPTQSTNSMINQSSNQQLQLSGTLQRAHILKQSKSIINSKTIGLMQQRILKSAESETNTNNDSNLNKQSNYISTQKPVLTTGVKINPLMQEAGLPPMGTYNISNSQTKQFARARGASNVNEVSSKNIIDGGSKKQPGFEIQLTPQALKGESQKKKPQTNKQRSAVIFSADQALILSPFTDSKVAQTKQAQQETGKSPIAPLQTSPYSTNTTNNIMGNRDMGINQASNDIMMQNQTYRTENIKNIESPQLINQKKLNNLLTQAQLHQQENKGEVAENGDVQAVTPKVTQSEKPPKRMAGKKNQKSASSDSHILGNLLLPFQQQQYYQTGKQNQVAIPTQQLISDQERERNDTIPEEPTISMDEFQSNQISFNGNPIDPSSGFNSLKKEQEQGAKQKESQPIQKQQQQIEWKLKKDPEQPAGPASTKNLNKRRENKLVQSQNLVIAKNSIDVNPEDAQGQKPVTILHPSNSSDKIKSRSVKPQSSRPGAQIYYDINNLTSDSKEGQQQQIVAKLSDRLSQNPLNLKKQALLGQSSSHKDVLLLSKSNKVGSNEEDQLRNPNDDLDDKDFDDCEEGQGVPDENPKLEQVKSMGLNPKSQLQNNNAVSSNAQRALRNQQINQPSGDDNGNGTRGLSNQNGPMQGGSEAKGKNNFLTQALTKQPQPLPKQEQTPQHSSPKTALKVEDNVAQFAYLTRPGRTGDGVSKTNQDNFFVVKNFAKIENLWYFGVCDGHGQNGHYVSEYVKNKLALDIMEIDIQMKEHQVARLAKSKQISTYDIQDQRNNSSFDSSQDVQTGNPFYNRKQSHDGSSAAYNELGEGMQASAVGGKLNNKRKSQDEKAADLLKLQMVKMVKSMPSNLLTDGARMHKLFTQGFRKNDMGLKNQGFGYEFSGSTIVTAMVQGNRIVTANAGDSRAVLGSLRSINYQLVDPKIESRALSVEDNEMSWYSKMLTRDHKPDDPDESERITAMNGRIESYKGRYGENVGPARVWLKTEQYPGLAMSRSIGDACAHSVGVSALPEIFEFHTGDEDKFLILASDGVWEFLSSDEVVDMIVPFWHRNDLKGACSTVVKESVAAWEREEDSIDDITCVIVFFKRTGPITDYSYMRSDQQNQQNSRQQQKKGPQENSQESQNNSNAASGEFRQSKGQQYLHKGRHLKKSKDGSSSGAKK